MPVTVIKDDVNFIVKAIRDLAKKQILVGIPSDAGAQHLGQGQIHSEERDPLQSGVQPKIGNAALGYIFEFGAPAINMPARAWLIPGVQEARSKIVPLFEQAARAAFEGNQQKVDSLLHAIGILNQTTIKVRITQKIPPPLAPRTIRARLRKSKLTSKQKSTMTAADFTPLIDTAQFINSISYIIQVK